MRETYFYYDFDTYHELKVLEKSASEVVKDGSGKEKDYSVRFFSEITMILGEYEQPMLMTDLWEEVVVYQRINSLGEYAEVAKGDNETGR